jgi:flagellin-like hook-associated protein FlgL
MAQVALELNERQLTYQAAMSSAARVLQSSLLDYLK